MAHANTVVYAFSALIDNMEEPETLLEMLKKIGLNHFKFGITINMFGELYRVIVDFLKEVIPDQMDEFHVDSWNKAYNTMITFIGEGLNEAAEAAGNQ